MICEWFSCFYALVLNTSCKSTWVRDAYDKLSVDRTSHYKARKKAYEGGSEGRETNKRRKKVCADYLLPI